MIFRSIPEGSGARTGAALAVVAAAALSAMIAPRPAAAQLGTSTFSETARLATDASRLSTAQPLLSLSAAARAQVSNDEMQVTLAVERDGTQLAELNAAVLAQLDAALAETRKVEGVRGRLGSLWTQPQIDRNGKPTGWRVRGEVVLESRDLKALPALAGRLAERMQLAGVQFRLSEARRKQEEARLLTEAARAFRERAADAARAFGFAGYAIRDLALDAPPGMPVPRPMFRARADVAMAAAQSVPVPAEGGESEVVVSVAGTVELRP